MTPHIKPAPGGPQRILRGLLAVLHFVLVGMLLYFRLGPMARVFTRFAEGDTPFPRWFTVGATAGTVALAAFLGLRGLRYLRGERDGRP